MLIITTLLMFFSMKYYMKSRVKDYSMFMTFGMRRRLLYLMVLSEYGIGWLCSVCMGLLLGKGLVIGCQEILKSVDVAYEISYSVHAKTYGFTLAASLAVMAAALFILMVHLGQRDLSELLKEEEKKEIRPENRRWLIMAAAGAALYVYAFRQYYRTDAGVLYAVIQWMVSGFLILGFGGNFLLDAVKRRQGFYYRRILQINQLYHRYNSNMLFISMVFAVHFLIMGYMACSVIENLPLEKDRSTYPYDYVWLGQEKDEGYVKEFTERAAGKYSSYPIIRLAAFAGSEHVGISESTFEEMTGRSVRVKDDEMYLFIEQTAYDGEEIADRRDYELIFQGVHTGKYRDMLYNVAAGSGEFNEQYSRYRIKKIERETIWGSISADNYHENTVVLSDKRFEEEQKKILDKADEPNEIFLLNAPKRERAQAGEELHRYVENYGIRDEHAGYEQNVLYDADRILEADFLRNLFNIISKCFIITAFCISGLFIIGMKVFAEIPQYGRKYEHLTCLGMRRKEERRGIGKEIKSLLHISLAAGAAYGLTYLCVTVKLGDMSAVRAAFYMKCWGMFLTVYLAVQFVLENVLAGILVRKVERCMGAAKT
ncbi:hypothetical protein C818_00392 [Lachnospiraceae bacterium MD308]|nr:hypothetical protein C818_00392 [Lachnospiraceae bacterium MD308]